MAATGSDVPHDLCLLTHTSNFAPPAWKVGLVVNMKQSNMPYSHVMRTITLDAIPSFNLYLQTHRHKLYIRSMRTMTILSLPSFFSIAGAKELR